MATHKNQGNGVKPNVNDISLHDCQVHHEFKFKKKKENAKLKWHWAGVGHKQFSMPKAKVFKANA